LAKVLVRDQDLIQWIGYAYYSPTLLYAKADRALLDTVQCSVYLCTAGHSVDACYSSHTTLMVGHWSYKSASTWA